MFTSLLLLRPSVTSTKGCALSAKGRVTHEDRTRDLRSHNPLKGVSVCCPMLQKPLI
jgi:hypothetical protein